jgi:PhnB protein
MTTRKGHIRHGFAAVRPYLHGHLDLADFVREVFRAVELERIEAGPKKFRIESQIGDSVVVHETGDPPHPSAAPASVYVYVEDVDAAYKRALEFGAAPIATREDQPYQDFSKVIELDPNDAEAYQFLGIIRLDEGKYQEALANFDRAIAINPRDAAGYHYRCLDYEGLRSFEKGISDCSRAIELGFALKLAETYHARGTSYAQLRQLDRTRADLDRAIEINPRYASAYFNRCIVKQTLGLQNAIADCKKAVEIEPDNQHM